MQHDEPSRNLNRFLDASPSSEPVKNSADHEFRLCLVFGLVFVVECAGHQIPVQQLFCRVGTILQIKGTASVVAKPANSDLLRISLPRNEAILRTLRCLAVIQNSFRNHRLCRLDSKALNPVNPPSAQKFCFPASLHFLAGWAVKHSHDSLTPSTLRKEAPSGCFTSA